MTIIYHLLDERREADFESRLKQLQDRINGLESTVETTIREKVSIKQELNSIRPVVAKYQRQLSLVQNQLSLAEAECERLRLENAQFRESPECTKID